MSAYDAKTLLTLWIKGELTTEQTVGHLVQRLLDHEERLRALERQTDPPPPSAS